MALIGNGYTIKWESNTLNFIDGSSTTLPIRARVETYTANIINAATNTSPLGFFRDTGETATTGIWYNNSSTASVTAEGIIANINTYYYYPNTVASDNLYWPSVPFPTETPKEKLRKLLAQRAVPHIITHAKPLGMTKDEREIRARETLLRVIGVQKFHDFLRKGFISIRAKSGLIYQIFPGHDFTKVYDCGKLVERLCVVLQGGFPPTDSLIMRYLMILNNEDQFRSFAVKHGVQNQNYATLKIQPDSRSLVEIFKEFKKAAA